METASHAAQVATQLIEIQKTYVGLVPLMPLIGAMFLGCVLFAKRTEKRDAQSGWIATVFALASFLATVVLFRELLQGADAVTFHVADWFSVDRLQPKFGFRFDRLSGVMTMVVTGVGTLIHLYAIGYMEHDDSRPRFFCYLNLFLFSMLLLVLGDNMLLMFVGWEGVGLCSYLLIGFWYKEMPNAVAGQKAFVVNRIGDAGFLLGMFVLFLALGTVNFVEITQNLGRLPLPLIELAAILLFVGAVGKSAQIPLFVWLPDAMAGPTPVSALIHAATMVTAGVYMITRLAPLYAVAQVALLIIAIIGACTAFLAATIALAQNDIKKVLAYSTVSQLGYMFMALGAGAFSNGIYHVVTHAFFKACLFMCAGSVIVGCHHEQDMRHFGGLRKYMPWTFAAYAMATYAIAGLPWASGFFSKDAILWAVFSSPGLQAWLVPSLGIPVAHVLWAMGLLTAFLTAFYMTRSLMLTFFGEYRGHEHPHESPWTMVVPLLVLAIPSLGFAWFYGESLMHFLGTWARQDMLLGHHELEHNEEYHMVELTSMVVAIAGVALSAILYTSAPQVLTILSEKFCGLYKALLNKWWIDELYDLAIVRPLAGISNLLFKVVDRSLIDAAVNGTGLLVQANGEIVRRMHTGRIPTYALCMFVGSVCSIVFWLLM